MTTVGESSSEESGDPIQADGDGAGGMYGRLPFVDPRGMTPDQRLLYERIAHSPRASGSRAMPLVDNWGHLLGPFNAMLHSPGIGLPLQEVGSAIRYGGTLPARWRELAILEVARHRRCAVEWLAHAHAGRLAGLTDSEVDAVLTGSERGSFTPEERLIRRLVAQLIQRRDLDDDTIAEAHRSVGLSQANELLMLVGYYDLLALSLTVWRTPYPGPDPFARVPEDSTSYPPEPSGDI